MREPEGPWHTRPYVVRLSDGTHYTTYAADAVQAMAAIQRHLNRMGSPAIATSADPLQIRTKDES